VTTLIGQIAFSVYGAVGIIMLPADLFFMYFYRPKIVSKAKFERRKNLLCAKIMKLRSKGKKLQEERILVGKITAVTGVFKRCTFSRQMRRY
jgi:hypothetical protein